MVHFLSHVLCYKQVYPSFDINQPYLHHLILFSTATAHFCSKTMRVIPIFAA